MTYNDIISLNKEEWFGGSMMSNNEISILEAGLKIAYIDNRNIDNALVQSSNVNYIPELITNDYKKGKKVLTSIEKELENADEFSISVAFITLSGITPLLQTLKNLELKNIKGRILTTDYLTFSEPKALLKLSTFKNIEIRLYASSKDRIGFHPKGYIFRKNEIYKIILGSSNITMDAITRNHEWNMKIISTSEGKITEDIINEFNALWNNENTFQINEVIEDYAIAYNNIKRIESPYISKKNIIEENRVTPNKMQTAFVTNLIKMIKSDINKALLISSTGTGKTYAAAFAVKELKPSKVLFLVHREQIAKQAMKSFELIINNDNKKYGLLSGSKKDEGADFLFSTIQMMTKPEIHEKYDEADFDIIILDEVHHAGAESYKRIMEYYKPKFWLGMTATPDTRNYDIYSIFDHNIAYEIRLQQSLEEDLICPFHYFGITELELEGKIVDDNTSLRDFNKLVSDERVDHIINKANYYGHCGERVKGLIFCSRKDEAKELSQKFNERGFRSVALTGEDSIDNRLSIINRLVTDVQNEKTLDYIFTVDIFNEGVDIPEINQIIMLRPTESPVIFIQQLGRGLRKLENKDYVVVLDFIGNYNNNYMIPIALSGDRSYNKDDLRRFISEGNRFIPGSSTIHFDEITRNRIYESIDRSNFSDIKIIKDSYLNLRNKLGRIPNLMDFELHGEIDVLRIFDNKNLKSYHAFLLKYEEEYKIKISDKARNLLEYVCTKFASGKRVHELVLMYLLMNDEGDIFDSYIKIMKKEYNCDITHISKANLYNIFTGNFISGSGKTTYENCVFIKHDYSNISISADFSKELLDPNFKNMLNEIIEFGLYRNRTRYNNNYEKTSFNLYAKYTYEEITRLLEWERSEVALNIGGYKYDEKTKTYPIFINYHKEEHIQESIKYEDRFINNSRLIAISKSGRTIESPDVQVSLRANELGVKVHLFVRKNKDDKTSKEFYYLGMVKATGTTTPRTMRGSSKKIVEIEYDLHTPVREDIFDYLINT